MPPVRRAESEVVVQSFGPINKKKLSRWCQRGPELRGSRVEHHTDFYREYLVD
jgi:hypothetical protein